MNMHSNGNGSDNENIKPNNGNKRHINLKPSIYTGNSNTNNNNGITKSNRKYRPDSVHSYPFMDTSGHVGDVLHSQSQSHSQFSGYENPDFPGLQEHYLCNTSYHGRMRLISKIYHEICASGGKMGLRYVDIPIALRSLGVTISSRVEQILIQGKDLYKRQSLNNMNSVGNTNTNTNGTNSNTNIPCTISLTQFQEIVKKCMNLQSHSGHSEQTGHDAPSKAGMAGHHEDNIHNDVESGVGNGVGTGTGLGLGDELLIHDILSHDDANREREWVTREHIEEEQQTQQRQNKGKGGGKGKGSGNSSGVKSQCRGIQGMYIYISYIYIYINIYTLLTTHTHLHIHTIYRA
mgnify:CR=1 FL=1